MPLVRLVLEGGCVDGNTPCLLFRGLVDLPVLHILGELLPGQHLRDRRSQRRLAVIDMADRSN